MSEKCHRSGKTVYAADKVTRIGGLIFHPGHFTCAATGTKLTLKTCTVSDSGPNGKDVYLKGKEPVVKPTPTKSVVDDRVMAVPDSGMRQTDRQFNVAGKKGRGVGENDLGSNYGEGGVAVVTQTSAPLPVTTVQNANLMEKRHNGSDGYTGATGEAAAE